MTMTENSSHSNRDNPSQSSEPQLSEELARAIQQALNRQPSAEATERLRLAAERVPHSVSSPVSSPSPSPVSTPASRSGATWSHKSAWAVAACAALILVSLFVIQTRMSSPLTSGNPKQTPEPENSTEDVVETENPVQPVRRTKVTLVSTTYQQLLNDLDAVEERMNECHESLSLAEVRREIQDTLYEFRKWPHRTFTHTKELSQ
jgi:hypothetical protein